MRNQERKRKWDLVGVCAALLLLAACYTQYNNYRVRTGDPAGLPPLHAAVTLDDQKEVLRLLKAGTFVDELDNERNTPLCYSRSKEMVELLLARGADIKASNQRGETPLHRVKTKQAMAALLDNGADVKVRDWDGETPLHDVPGKTLARLLVKAGADIEARDARGFTPLMSACNGGVVTELLRLGADPLAVSTSVGMTALHRARDAKSVEALIAGGVPVNITTTYGDTPLESSRDEKVTIALLRGGADPDAAKSRSPTKLWSTSDPKMATALIAAGADINVTFDGQSVLQRALKQNAFDVAEILIEAGAKLPGHWAWTQIEHQGVIKALLNEGVPLTSMPRASYALPHLRKESLQQSFLPSRMKAELLAKSWLKKPTRTVTKTLLIASEAYHTDGILPLDTVVARYRSSQLDVNDAKRLIDVILECSDVTDSDLLQTCDNPWLAHRLLAAGASKGRWETLNRLVRKNDAANDKYFELVALLLDSAASKPIGDPPHDFSHLYSLTTGERMRRLLERYGYRPAQTSGG